ncbi:Mannan endo-1,4-beta-mannosidase 1 [Acorus gramineus]|uniref:Mannan endo-1,4-beta-mannosidase 1 n=1 Tax=Acorus gramineus TaxID=55184 RepID=A0AAV9BQF5_ACOGR|nr:Mannan endo-1,4-beta-mannosidase 1 [Acorus gramineus]
MQDWISIMAKYVKSLDSNHLLEVGLEGFYGPSTPEKFKIDPGFLVGTDYITNHQVEDIYRLHHHPRLP